VDELDDVIRRQQQHIDTVGWSVTIVLPEPDAEAYPFAYTVGLTAQDRPELLIAGLDPQTAHTLLNDLASRVIDQAARFTHGQRITDLLAGYDVIIVEGPSTEALHPGAAYALYGADRVRLQQVVWPDPHGHFPWDTHYIYDPVAQPLLGRP
jgi:hypothetical protein